MKQDQSIQHWNLFAHELVDILAVRGIALEHLQDHITILPDKVRRLCQSLNEPASFLVLNEDEIDQLTRFCGLSSSEHTRLHAAILTTMVEKLLMNCIDQEDALLAAKTILPMILQGLQKQNTDTTKRGSIHFSEGDEIDLALEMALKAFEDGELALHLSHRMDLHSERAELARLARQKYKQALAELNTVEEDIHAMQDWHNWYAEAQQGLKAANARLEELGIDSEVS